MEESKCVSETSREWLRCVFLRGANPSLNKHKCIIKGNQKHWGWISIISNKLWDSQKWRSSPRNVLHLSLYTTHSSAPFVVFLCFLRVNLCLEDCEMTVCHWFGEAMENSFYTGGAAVLPLREKNDTEVTGEKTLILIIAHFRWSLVLYLDATSVVAQRGCLFPLLLHNLKAAFTIHSLDSQWRKYLRC